MSRMKVCPTCKELYGVSAAFCQKCGADIASANVVNVPPPPALTLKERMGEWWKEFKEKMAAKKKALAEGWAKIPKKDKRLVKFLGCLILLIILVGLLIYAMEKRIAKSRQLIASHNQVMTLDKDTDRPGANFKEVGMGTDPEECRSACIKDPKCQAFAFFPFIKSGMCYLKDEKPAAVKRPGFYSGVRINAEPELKAPAERMATAADLEALKAELATVKATADEALAKANEALWAWSNRPKSKAKPKMTLADCIEKCKQQVDRSYLEETRKNGPAICPDKCKMRGFK